MKIYSMVPQKEYIYYLFSFIAPLFKSFAKEGLLLSGPGFFKAVSSPGFESFGQKSGRIADDMLPIAIGFLSRKCFQTISSS